MLYPRHQRLGYHIVIDTPAQIPGTRSRSIAPPGVMVRIGSEMSKCVHKPRVNEVLHPFTFLRQEARRIRIGLRVMDIYCTMTDIKVTTDNQVRTFLPQLVHVLLEVC